MNKILFTYKRNFNTDIILVANNVKDLVDYLETKYNFYYVEAQGETIKIVENAGAISDYVELEWIKHI